MVVLVKKKPFAAGKVAPYYTKEMKNNTYL